MRANRWIMTVRRSGALRARLLRVMAAMICASVVMATTSNGTEPEYRTREDYGLVGIVRSITIRKHVELGDGTSVPCYDSTMITFDVRGRRVSEVFTTSRLFRGYSWGTFWEFDDAVGCVDIRYVIHGPRAERDGVLRYDSVIAAKVETHRYPPISNGDPRIFGEITWGRRYPAEWTGDSAGNWIRCRRMTRERTGTMPAMFNVIERRIVYGSGRTDSPSLHR